MVWILTPHNSLEMIFNSHPLGIDHDHILPRLGFCTNHSSNLTKLEAFYIFLGGEQSREFQEEQSKERQKNLLILKRGIGNQVSRDTLVEISQHVLSVRIVWKTMILKLDT